MKVQAPRRTCINFVGDSISSSVSAGFGRTNAGETPALLNMVKQPHLQNCYRLVGSPYNFYVKPGPFLPRSPVIPRND